MAGTKWVRRSDFLYNMNNSNAYCGSNYASPVYIYCVYIGYRELKLMIAFENFVLFALLMPDYQCLVCVLYLFGTFGKSLQLAGGGGGGFREGRSGYCRHSYFFNQTV